MLPGRFSIRKSLGPFRSEFQVAIGLGVVDRGEGGRTILWWAFYTGLWRRHGGVCEVAAKAKRMPYFTRCRRRRKAM